MKPKIQLIIKFLVVLTFIQFATQNLLCQPVFPNPDIQLQETHNGDLELSGDQTMLVENTHLVVYGNVILKDSAQLIMRQSILELPGISPSISLFDRSVLQADTSIFGGVDAAEKIDASKAEMLKGGNILTDLNSQLILNNCFSQTQTFMGNSVVVIKNSFLVKEPLGIVHIEGNADVQIEDSYIGAIYLELAPDNPLIIDSLFPGYLEYWSAKEDIDENLSFNMILKRCELSENTLGYKGGMELGWNIALNAIASDVSISNSVLNKIILYFPQDEPTNISELKLHEPIDFDYNNIRIRNTVVQTQWGIFLKGGSAELVNSEGLFIFMEGGNGDIIVHNSEVGEIDPRRYTGNLIFENSTWHSGYEIWDESDIKILGNVRMLPTVPIFDSTSTMTRSFEIFLINDLGGNPYSGVDLYLSDDSVTVWSGTTNEEGRVDLTITFDINNVFKKWELNTTEPAIRLNKRIGIQNSNPVIINLEPESDGIHFRNVLHVQSGDQSFPTGTRDNPYPNIQEAIDNSDGDIIYVHEGSYFGRTEPGAETGNINLKDSVIILGDGPGSTFLNAVVNIENVHGVHLSGFTLTESLQAISSSMNLTNNVIKSSSPTAIWGFKSEMDIINNTIIDHDMDAIFLHDSCLAKIENNIIVNNGTGITGLESSSAVLDYNDIWSNDVDYFEFFSPGGNDISKDPLFTDQANKSYHLMPASPCINTGDPDPIMNDPDGSRNDMGAYGGPLSHQQQINAQQTVKEQKAWQTFPNPVSKDLWIELLPIELPATLNLYSLNGRKLSSYVLTDTYSAIDMSSYNPSIYILKLRTGNQIYTKKIVKK